MMDFLVALYLNEYEHLFDDEPVVGQVTTN